MNAIFKWKEDASYGRVNKVSYFLITFLNYSSNITQHFPDDFYAIIRVFTISISYLRLIHHYEYKILPFLKHST